MILIGISGVSCSGKTTLLQNLADHYGEVVGTLSFDDYFIGSDFKNVDEIEDFESPEMYNFDALYDDLRKIKRGESIKLRANSLESAKSGISEKTVVFKDIVIVEGWLLYYDSRVVDLFDGKIYIDVDEETITKRRYGRTNGAKHWDSLEYISEKIIPAFHKYVEPQRGLADLLLNGTDNEEKLVNETVSFIDEIKKVN